MDGPNSCGLESSPEQYLTSQMNPSIPLSVTAAKRIKIDRQNAIPAASLHALDAKNDLLYLFRKINFPMSAAEQYARTV